MTKVVYKKNSGCNKPQGLMREMVVSAADSSELRPSLAECGKSSVVELICVS
jgi:hypothetical protein